MSASGPRSRGASVHPRACQGVQPWPRASAAPDLVLATQNLDGITGRGTRYTRPRPMDLYEHQGKELFRRFGIPVSDGRLATTPAEARAVAEELGGQVVVKAQVLTGGRGKAGGIKLAEGGVDAEAKARGILGMDI